MAYVPAEAFGRSAVVVPNNAWIYSVASNSKSTAVVVPKNAWIYSVASNSKSTAVAFTATFTTVIPAFLGSSVPSPVLVQIVGGGGAYLIGYPSG